MRRYAITAAGLILAVVLDRAFDLNPAAWIGMLAVITIYLLVTWPPVQRRIPFVPDPPSADETNRVALADEAIGISNEIARWVTELRQEDDADSDSHRRAIRNATTEEERNRLHYQSIERSMRKSQALMARYNEQVAARALSVFDRLVELGMVDGADRFELEHPTNPLGLGDVSRILGAAGHRLDP